MVVQSCLEKDMDFADLSSASDQLSQSNTPIKCVAQAREGRKAWIKVSHTKFSNSAMAKVALEYK